MSATTLIVGNDGANTLQGTSGNDLIYGFDPNGPQADVNSIPATRVASGLMVPVFAGAPEGDPDRLFIVEETGTIKILDLATGQVAATPFLDVSSQVAAVGEQGLLGLAFDPHFAQNGFVYIDMINASGDTEIRRYQVFASDPNQVDPATATLIITVDQPAGRTNHKAGWLGFGPDGYLYAALGDGGSGGDPDNLAQNTDSLLGKILRLDVSSDAFPADPTRNYAIPADNPFVNAPGADEIWALGLRNPWRPSFDRGLGDFYIANVGQGVWEEIDIGALGANYGWRTFEGPADFSPTTVLGGGTLTAPIYSYDHTVGQAITGGYVYRGESEGLQGQYFFADFVQGKIFTLRFNGTSLVTTERTSQITADVGAINLPSSFGEDGFGNLYVVDYDEEIFRLTPDFVSADQADTLNGGDGDDIAFAGAGNDVLDGGAGADSLEGWIGNDMMIGSAGADTLTGGLGDDTLRGSEQADQLYGGEGDDLMSAGKGLDRLDGGNGNDTLTGGIGNDTLIGGAGKDTADYSTSSDGVTASLATGIGGSTISVPGVGSGTDSLTGIENLTGSLNDDSLIGNTGNNVLIGLDGSDTLDGGDGNDNLSGGLKADVLTGELGNDLLAGGQGIDTLDGGDGNDTLRGALGTDVLTGGLGADHFVFASVLDGLLNIDTLTDFQSGSDVIEISASIFTAFSGQVGSTIGVDGNVLRYDAATGSLAYDADGAGANPALTFAVLGTSSHPATLGSDFKIVA